MAGSCDGLDTVRDLSYSSGCADELGSPVHLIGKEPALYHSLITQQDVTQAERRIALARLDKPGALRAAHARRSVAVGASRAYGVGSLRAIVGGWLIDAGRVVAGCQPLDGRNARARIASAHR
jgi:hypothetical protein